MLPKMFEKKKQQQNLHQHSDKIRNNVATKYVSTLPFPFQSAANKTVILPTLDQLSRRPQISLLLSQILVSISVWMLKLPPSPLPLSFASRLSTDTKCVVVICPLFSFLIWSFWESFRYCHWSYEAILIRN